MAIPSRERLRERLGELLRRVQALREQVDRLQHEKKVLLLTWQERWREVQGEVGALRAYVDQVLSYDGKASRVGRSGPYYRRPGRSRNHSPS